jgi:hypothetical protein
MAARITNDLLITENLLEQHLEYGLSADAEGFDSRGGREGAEGAEAEEAESADPDLSAENAEGRGAQRGSR